MQQSYRFLLLTLIALLCIPSTAHALRDVEQVALTQNTNIWLIEDNTAPIIAIHMAIQHGGYAYDPTEKHGLSYLTKELLLEGTTQTDHETLHDTLDRLGIILNTYTDRDYLHITLKSLSENKEKAIALLTEILLEPAFSEEALSRVKAYTHNERTKEEERIRSIAEKQWNMHSLSSHPYAHADKGTTASVDAITTEDIHTFWKDRLCCSRFIISVVGDITPGTASALFSPLAEKIAHKTATQQNDIPAFTQLNTTPQHIAHSTPQSVAIFGQKGVPYHHPDFYAAYIANHILGGGGFESRLMKTVRETHGLAYSVYSYLANYQHAALLKGYVATRNDAIDTSLSLIKEEMRKLQTEGISEEELTLAKRYLTGSFVINLDSNNRMARYLTFMQINALGPNFMKERNQRIAAVTHEEINRVARTLFTPDTLAITIVGTPPASP